MKNVSYFLILLLLTTYCFIGCGSDIKYTDLGDGYSLGPDDINRAYIYISDSNYRYQYNPIKMHILDYAFDTTFIVAAQRPWDSVPEAKTMVQGRNRVFDKSKVVQYWIINKKEEPLFQYDSITQKGYYKNVYGPYKKEEYLNKKDEMRVPENLKLKKYE